jgi:hypothetical protein
VGVRPVELPIASLTFNNRTKPAMFQFGNGLGRNRGQAKESYRGTSDGDKADDGREQKTTGGQG